MRSQKLQKHTATEVLTLNLDTLLCILGDVIKLICKIANFEIFAYLQVNF